MQSFKCGTMTDKAKMFRRFVSQNSSESAFPFSSVGTQLQDIVKNLSYINGCANTGSEPIENLSSSGELPVSEMLGELKRAALNFFNTLKMFAQGFPVWTWWESRNRAAQIPPQSPTGQVQLQPSAASQLEEQPALPTVRQPNNNDDDRNPNFVDYVLKMQWALLVIGVCFSAFSAALQTLHTPAPLPPTFHWFCMLLELAFLSFLVSVYIRRRYETASLFMAHVAIFLGATAFMLVIGVTFPAPLIGISIALFFVAILAIIFANR